MKDVGFVISSKEHERRRALSPELVTRIRHAARLRFEIGYGEVLGAGDNDYVAAGARVVPREEAWACSVVRRGVVVDRRIADSQGR